MTTINLAQMSRAEKLKMMHALWEDLAREDNTVESPEWHGQVLRETEDRVRSGIEQSHDWEAAKSQLRKRAG